MSRSPDSWIARRTLYAGRLFEIGYTVCRPTPDIRHGVEYAKLNVLPLLSTLRDDFDSGVIDPAIWLRSAGPGIVAQPEGGQVRISPPVNLAGYGLYESVTTFDARESGGLGVHIVRRMFAGLHYERRASHNVTTIVHCDPPA